MFIEVFFLSIIIGYILKGSVKNIDSSKIRGLYLVFAAFIIEFLIVMSMKKGLLNRGVLTYLLDLIMYGLLFQFIYINRKNVYIVLMGIGFILNAIPIFLNGGAMPVSAEAAVYAGIIPDIKSARLSTEGLYTLIDSNTKLWFLGDIIPRKYPRGIVFSIGDVISVIGLALFIITEMKKSQQNS
jgi:hypothetical protein